MKRAFMVACLILGLLAFIGCASTGTAAKKEKEKPVGWGTVNTIESEGTAK